MYSRILVPVDGSSTSNHGLAEAIRLARLTQGQLCLIHVLDELSFALPMDAYAGYTGYAGYSLAALQENAGKLLEQARLQVEAEGLKVDTVLYDKLAGSVYELVTAEAAKWPADLIVLGTHGRRGVGRVLMDSSAESILRYATVPVLLVRSVEAVTEKPKKLQASMHVKLPSAALAFE